MGLSDRSVLVTGAAGFVGSHTVDLLVENGYRIIALDALDPQVHGPGATFPHNIASHLEKKTLEFIHGDVRDRDLIARLLPRVEAVVHLAAAVGVGQSMYMPHYYADVNIGGTAVLMDVLANQRDKKPRKIVVASSMSIYGEGAYRCPACGPSYPEERSPSQLADREWDHRCSHCGQVLQRLGTPESKPLVSTSIYAITKKVQEEMLLVFGRAYEIPVVALRYFNIYGPRQSLSNPYTGVAAIFLSRYLNGKPPLVFEDGLQSRDFIHVRDIARANLAALEAPGEMHGAYNVGTGKPTTILDVARLLSQGLGIDIPVSIANQYRAGDIRHCYSDSSRIAEALRFEPKVSSAEGFQDLIEWSRKQKPADQFEASLSELRTRSLVH